MSESGTDLPDKVWIGTIISWLIATSGVPQDKLDLGAKFVEAPYNLTNLDVLHLIDHLIAMHRQHYGETGFTLSQNWRLKHRAATVGDFLVAFLEVVKSDSAGRPKRSGIG